jgi:membrane protein DedA with SNARE-associated domain
MGYADWLMTIIGIVYLGAVEVNPLFAGLTRTNLAGFTAVKLNATIFVGVLCYLGERMLQNVEDKNSKPFLYSRIILRTGYLITIAFLLITILNNLIVIANII